MNKTLGIYVTSERHMDKLLNLCRAAHKKGVKIKLFFTHMGTRLGTTHEVKELSSMAEIALCKVGFEANRLDRQAVPLPDKAFASQSWHAEMIYDCDRYLVL